MNCWKRFTALSIVFVRRGLTRNCLTSSPALKPFQKETGFGGRLRKQDEIMKTKIKSKGFRVRQGEKVKLKEWPTMVKPFCKSKKAYRKLLEEHVMELSSLQQLHYASNRYA